MLVHNLNLLNCELRVSLAVLRELPSQNREANLKLVEVGTSHLYEDVLGLQRDLGCVRIDDWREGQDGSLGIIEDGELGLILNDVHVLLKLLILL